MEWIWPVALIVILVAPVLRLLRMRTPFQAPPSSDASQLAAGLEQARHNNRLK